MNEKEQVAYSGFEAQEVEKAAAAIGYNFSVVVKPQNEKDHYSMVYSDFIPSLVKAIQELKRKTKYYNNVAIPVRKWKNK